MRRRNGPETTGYFLLGLAIVSTVALIVLGILEFRGDPRATPYCTKLEIERGGVMYEVVNRKYPAPLYLKRPQGDCRVR